MGNEGEAGGIAVGLQEFFVVLCQLWRTVKLQLGYLLTVGAGYCGVDIGSYVQDDRIVCCILMMTMAVPVGSTLVYFYITYPKYALYLDFGIEKVGSGMWVGKSRIDDFDGFSLGGVQMLQREKLVFPYIV